MTTQKMFDKGLRCRGRGFCGLCKETEDCVEYIPPEPKETKTVSYDKGSQYEIDLADLQAEGWRIIGSEPIEKIRVEIVGQRFYLERDKLQDS